MAKRTGKYADIGQSNATYRHPHFSEFEAEWRKLADVKEGRGGFLTTAGNGSYIVPHPREWQDFKATTPTKPTKKLQERRKIARYENFAATLLTQMLTALFREAPMRVLGQENGARPDMTPSGIHAWWEAVETRDGQKISMDLYMRTAWEAAGTFGHVLVYMDLPSDQGSTAADQAQPLLRTYLPQDVADWLTDDLGNLIAVKLMEPVPRATFTDRIDSTQCRYRVVTEEDWILYDYNGKTLEFGTHGLGTLPCVLLFAQRRLMYQHIGKSVLDSAQLFIDHFNLISEFRELLRKQTFSILNVPLGTGPDAMDIEKAKSLLNQEVSTEGVLFSGTAAGFISAEAANLVGYMDAIQALVRTIYRLAGVFFESDSKDAEAEGSLKLKREDMSQRLAGYAAECERADLALAQLWYRYQFGADGWGTRWDADEVTVQYPKSFDVTPFDVVLEQAEAALSLGFPPGVLKALRKQLLGKFLPSMPPQLQKELEKEIDSAEDDVLPQQIGQARLTALQNTGKEPPVKKEAA